MNTIFKRLIWVIIIAPAVYLAFAWSKMPQTVTVHFDLEGNPDRLGSKQELLLAAGTLIVTNAIVYLIVTNIYRIDPKKYAADNKDRLARIAFAVAIFLSAVLCLIIYSSSHGNIKFNSGVILAGMGLLFAFIGNYLPNLKPNYFAGLRLPWTLENPENWRKTHALAGKLWFIGGLALAVLCLFLPAAAANILFFTIITVITLIPCIYSYRMFQKQKTHQ